MPLANELLQQPRRSLRLRQTQGSNHHLELQTDDDVEEAATKTIKPRKRKQSKSTTEAATIQNKVKMGCAITAKSVTHGNTLEAAGRVDHSNTDDDSDHNLLLDLGKLIRGRLVQRPSATIRSPYVADVVILGANGEELDTVLAHSPALDVGGLCVPSAIVYMSERLPGGKTSHSIELVVAPAPDSATIEGDNGILVGSHPNLGEKLAEAVLTKGLLEEVIGFGPAKLDAKASSPKKKRKKNPDVEDESSPSPRGIVLCRQRTYGDSRVDFELTDYSIESSSNDGSSSRPRSLVEVKNVVCSDYASNLAPVKTGPNHCVIKSDSENYSRSAIFPWGRVGQTFEGKKVVSERAIKHLRNLGSLTTTDENINAIVLFVINRSDCDHMRACHEACPVFASELKAASEKGCIVTSFRVRWTLEGKAYFDGIVPVTL
jgi:hypothetical protein